MKLDHDKYQISTNLKKEEILSILSDRTLIKMSLITEKTNKDFIGQINGSNFSVINSSFTIGAACVINGRIDNSNIDLNTNLHRGLRILFWFWLIALIGVITFFSLKDFYLLKYLGTILTLLVGAVIFRAVIHFVYIQSRNQAINKLKRLLSVKS
jgi:hypothetical protein